MRGVLSVMLQRFVAASNFGDFKLTFYGAIKFRFV